MGSAVLRPIGWETVKTLLTSTEFDDSKTLTWRGVAAVYVSVCSEFGQG
ncbi:MAG: hypothetical protein ACU837_11155 [Gammaproteobacteria bacterium]